MRKVELMPTQDCEAGYGPAPPPSSPSLRHPTGGKLHTCLGLHRTRATIYCSRKEDKWFWNHESRLNIHESMWIQWQFLQKLEPKVIGPYMTFDPTSVEVLCVTLPKDHCVRVPWKYIKVCGYSDLFCKKKTWTKGHWPLDDLWPHICWGHMCDSTQRSLCPSPMKIHQSMWIQWTVLLKLEPKVIDP